MVRLMQLCQVRKGKHIKNNRGYDSDRFNLQVQRLHIHTLTLGFNLRSRGMGARSKNFRT